MRVLVACEYSGVVRDAFAAKGHDVWSCDLLPSLRAGLHHQGDVRQILDGWVPIRFYGECDPEDCGECKVSGLETACCNCLGPTQDGIEYTEIDDRLFGRPQDAPRWDLMIAHPPCTYLARAGLHWNYKVLGRAEKTEEALGFVQMLLDAPIPRIALENPMGRISTVIRPPDQTIQPWQFGHPESKTTCLWLKGLPKLKETNVLPKPPSGRWQNQTPSGQNKVGASKARWAKRSKTYSGIAEAMADQWGPSH